MRYTGRTCVCISIHLQVFFMCAHMYACLWLCEVSVHSCGCIRTGFAHACTIMLHPEIGIPMEYKILTSLLVD